MTKQEKINLEFVPLDETEFKLYDLDITEIISKEELIEKINEINFEENNLIEIILTGKRNFEIDRYELYKLISNDKVIKIKDKTKINYDLEKLSNDTTLKGLFAKEKYPNKTKFSLKTKCVLDKPAFSNSIALLCKKYSISLLYLFLKFFKISSLTSFLSFNSSSKSFKEIIFTFSIYIYFFPNIFLIVSGLFIISTFFTGFLLGVFSLFNAFIKLFTDFLSKVISVLKLFVAIFTISFS